MAVRVRACVLLLMGVRICCQESTEQSDKGMAVSDSEGTASASSFVNTC